MWTDVEIDPDADGGHCEYLRIQPGKWYGEGKDNSGKYHAMQIKSLAHLPLSPIHSNSKGASLL